MLPDNVVSAIEIANASATPPPELLKVLRKVEVLPPCVIGALEKINLYDCSELGQLRVCLWRFIRDFEWSKPLPKGLRKILSSLSTKDKVVPSNRLIDRLEYFKKDGLFTACILKSLRKTIFCVETCMITLFQQAIYCPCAIPLCAAPACPLIACDPIAVCEAYPDCPVVECVQETCPEVTCPRCPNPTCSVCPIEE